MLRRAALLAPLLLLGCGYNPFKTGGGGPNPDPGPFPFDLGIGMAGPTDPPPEYGTTTQASPTPPPISGGTLVVTRDGTTAVAADADRDAIFVVDLAGKSVRTIQLQPGDEPGRGAEDGARRVHVALRRGGAVVDVDAASGQLIARRTVCPAPRGIAWDSAADVLYVACASGELVTLPAATGGPTRVIQLERDLRDVVVDGTNLYVSKFKSAELLTLDANGQLVQRVGMPSFSDPVVRNGSRFEPALAWRTVAFGPGQVAVVHQRALADLVMPSPGGYGGDGGKCPSGIVHTTVETAGPNATTVPGPALLSTVLPVDMAIDARGNYAIVAAGNAHTPPLSQLVFGTLGNQSPCQSASFGAPGLDNVQLVAVAADAQGNLYAQSREPAALLVLSSIDLPPPVVKSRIDFAAASVEDTGHAIFHSNSGGSLACASCHAEGGEDGRTWNFDMIGPRRTQSMRIGVIGTEPFHWDGDETDLQALIGDVFVGRMSGPPLAVDQQAALKGFLGGIAPWPAIPASDAASAARGQALFQGDAGCVGCHTGPKLTVNTSVIVGTSNVPLQVPSLLGVGWRAPWIHDGCAAALADRFIPGCGGGDLHGHTSQLGPGDVADLVNYLNTL
jgi:mono/diheme cytochrome c family protein